MLAAAVLPALPTMFPRPGEREHEWGSIAIAMLSCSLDIVAYVLHHTTTADDAELCPQLEESFKRFDILGIVLTRPSDVLPCLLYVARWFPATMRSLFVTRRALLHKLIRSALRFGIPVAPVHTLFEVLKISVEKNDIMMIFKLLPKTCQQESGAVPFRRLLCETLRPRQEILEEAFNACVETFLLDEHGLMDCYADWQRIRVDRWNYAIKTLGMKPDASFLLFAFDVRYIAPHILDELLDVYRVLSDIVPPGRDAATIASALFELFLKIDDEDDTTRERIFRDFPMPPCKCLPATLIAKKLHTEKGREILRRVARWVPMSWHARGYFGPGSSHKLASNMGFESIHGQCSTVEELRFVQEAGNGSVDWMARIGGYMPPKVDHIVIRWLSYRGLPPHSPNITSLLETLHEFGVSFAGYGLLYRALRRDSVAAFTYFVTKHKLHQEPEWTSLDPPGLSQMFADSAIADAIRDNKIPPFSAADVPPPFRRH